MPRVAQPPSNRTSASDPLAAGHPNVLKRNQACHQCRRRKLETSHSDAKRPCSTCVRSHAHAVAHAPPGTNLPSRPECTFDEIAENNMVPSEGPKSKYEKLENRISELEALLLQKDSASGQPTAPRSPPSMSSIQSLSPGPSSELVIGNVLGSHGFPFNQSPITSPSDLLPFSHDSYTSVADFSSNGHKVSTSPGLDIIWPNWPANLPGPDLLRHLVEVFFVFHPHANRLFHCSTFMGTLSLPPSHPRFPSPPVLHAICAIGSLYTAAVTSPPLPDFTEHPPDEIFLLRQRLKEQRADSFAEQQAKYAREAADRLNALGEDLFQVFQANIILSWFYWSHSRWVDVFLFSAHTVRLSIPLGLNMCPPFHSISKFGRPASILPPARTVIEDETRRNSFWLAYALERQHGCGNGWAFSLDDQDVTQLLPVRSDQFEDGALVSPSSRQWAHTRDLLLMHPPTQTDSFILYIKGTILISQVKTFNLRFRSKHFAGDTSVANPLSDPTDSADPRGSPAFNELDHIVSSFRTSFPAHLRNPITENVVDNHLYTAFLMPSVATILLHDPHADVRQSGCISALKILTAARSILDLIYGVYSTSFDISLLDSFCSFAWFLSGRVLSRFLQAALDTKSRDQISTLRAELDFVQSAIAKIGRRIPLAFRFAKMLEDLVIKQCGSASGPPGGLAFSRTIEAAAVHTLLRQNLQQDNIITI